MTSPARTTPAARSAAVARKNGSQAARKPARQQLDAATLTISEEDQPPASEIDVDLIGVRYSVTPPKAAIAMRIAWLAAERDADEEEVMRALDGWIDKAFGPEQSAAVRHRLYEDDEDPLDFRHIMLLMQKLVEVQTSLPTSPPSGS